MTDTTTATKSFAFTLNGVAHTLAIPLAIKDTIRLRSEVGWSQAQLLEFLKDPDLDTFAVCVWLARLQAGETIAFDVVAEMVTYESALAIAPVEDDHPES